MNDVTLIPVAKDGEYLEVHPTALAQHKQLGWRECEKRDIEPAGPTRAELDSALASLPGTYTDPDYVVRSMRSHFGDLFTDADEATVRDLVKPAPKKPSEGLKVEDLKAALVAKGVTIPENVTLKADLAALLDAQPE